ARPGQAGAGRAGLAVAAAAAAAVAAIAVADRDPPWGVGVVWDGVPREAARFVADHHLPPTVYNDFDTGSYLNWAWAGAPPTFQDGRALGGVAFVRDCDRILRGRGIEPLLARYRVQTVLTSTLFPSSGRIFPSVWHWMTSPAWRLVDASDALVFVRAGAAPGVPGLPRRLGWRRIALDGEAVAASRPAAAHAAYTAAVAWTLAGDTERARLWRRRARERHPELAAAYAPLLGAE
ncbi:MAG: hypothetical protein D6739_01720, partial [Nitrospirae bacterium]